MAEIEVEKLPGAATVRYRYADGTTRQVGPHHGQGRTVRHAPARAVDLGATDGTPVEQPAGVLGTTG